MPGSRGRDGARQLCALGRSRSSKTDAQVLAARVGAKLSSGLGIDEPKDTRVRQFLLSRVPDLDRDHVVAAGELEQRPAPVLRPPKVADDDHRRPLPGERRGAMKRLTERRGADVLATRLIPQARQDSEQPEPSLPGREGTRPVVAEGHEPETVAPSRRYVPDRDRDALGDVRLASVSGAELHRSGRVQYEPRHEHTLCEVHADVRDIRARGDIPVDPAHVVVPRNVRTDLCELRPVAEKRGTIVAREQALHLAPDADVERAEQRVRQRPRPRPRGCRLGVERMAHQLYASDVTPRRTRRCPSSEREPRRAPSREWRPA